MGGLDKYYISAYILNRLLGCLHALLIFIGILICLIIYISGKLHYENAPKALRSCFGILILEVTSR